MGRPDLVASQCVTVVGIGRLSGKYFIDSITHTVGGGYTMDLELSLVEAMTKEVIKDATDRLAAVGVMASPEYWAVSYTHLRAHETGRNLVCRLLLEKKKKKHITKKKKRREEKTINRKIKR